MKGIVFVVGIALQISHEGDVGGLVHHKVYTCPCVGLPDEITEGKMWDYLEANHPKSDKWTHVVKTHILKEDTIRAAGW